MVHSSDLHGELISVNVGGVQAVQTKKREVMTGIWKHPVEGRLAVRGVNIAGDSQADLENHGGPDKAIYAYASEDTAWWEEELERPLGPGALGENLTTRGLDLSAARIGDRWRVGTTLLEVRQTRIPCFKLGLRLEEPRMVKRFVAADRPGAYLAIVEEGELGAGDAIALVERPDHEVTTVLMSRAVLKDESLLPGLLEAPALPEYWREQISQRVDIK
jgi:MOSC domain-containing protein YiiM